MKEDELPLLIVLAELRRCRRMFFLCLAFLVVIFIAAIDSLFGGTFFHFVIYVFWGWSFLMWLDTTRVYWDAWHHHRNFLRRNHERRNGNA